MLELIRRYSSSAIVKAFLGILAATFVFCFGISDIIRRYMGKDYIVKIGNIKITPALFNLEKAKKLHLLRNQGNIVDEKLESVRVLHQIIWENVIDLVATDFGFIVSDETIKKYIAGMSLFRDKNGYFRPEMLRSFLYRIQVPEQMFIEFSRRDIKNELIKTPLKYVSVYRELDYHIKSQMERRTLSIVEIDPNKLVVTKKTTEKELENFYSENTDLFMIPESRSLKIAELLESDIAKNILISDEEIKDFYESSSEKETKTYEDMKLTIKEELRQEKLQNAIDDVVRQVEDALIAGESMEDVAKKFNLKITEIEDVNAQNKCTKSSEVIKKKYKNDILTVAFSTDEGADSPFTETVDENGNKILWMVHVDSITPKHSAKFSTKINDIQKEFTKKRQVELALELAESFTKKVRNGEKLSTIASKNGYISLITEAFDRYGITASAKDKKKNPKKNDDKISKIITELHENAFSMNKEEALHKQIGKTIVVAQVQEIIPAENINLKDRSAYQVRLTKDWAEDLLQQIIGYVSKHKYEVKINHEMLKESGQTMDLSDLDGIF